ncbi:MAG: hypothetical protein AB7Q76_01095 [Gammaproteobacteria bacterium]
MTGLHPSTRPEHDGAWLRTLRRYIAFVVPAHLLWEFAQLPLYTIWRDGTAGEILFAVVHCTGGDALIATTALVTALLLAGTGWPISRDCYRRVAVIAIVIGVGYTAFSEWLNTAVREAWAYSDLMPVIPLVEAGLSPVLQWVLIPLAGFWWARRPIAGVEQRIEAHA